MASRPRGSRRWAGKGGKGSEIEEVAMVGGSGRREENKALGSRARSLARVAQIVPGAGGL